MPTWEIYRGEEDGGPRGLQEDGDGWATGEDDVELFDAVVVGYGPPVGRLEIKKLDQRRPKE